MFGGWLRKAPPDPRAARVAVAAKLMDELRPGWAENINVARLDLFDYRMCIAGQNNLDWNDVRRALNDRNDYPWSGHGVFSSNLFRPFWLKEIEARVPVGVPELALSA